MQSNILILYKKVMCKLFLGYNYVKLFNPLKQFHLLLIFLFLFSSCENKTKQISQIFYKDYDYTVRVTGVVDGDTFKGLTVDNKEIRFRLYGIDAPEKNQAFGNKSKQYLSELIHRQTVGIKVQKKSDGYGRPVVWVFNSEGKEINSEMLKAGMAWHFKKYDSSAKYSGLEKQARQQKIGLWIDSNPVAPWDFRNP